MAKNLKPTPQAVKAIREKLGLTQNAAAELLETSRRTYIAWETGETKIQPIIFRWFSEQVRA